MGDRCEYLPVSYAAASMRQTFPKQLLRPLSVAKNENAQSDSKPPRYALATLKNHRSANGFFSRRVKVEVIFKFKLNFKDFSFRKQSSLRAMFLDYQWI